MYALQCVNESRVQLVHVLWQGYTVVTSVHRAGAHKAMIQSAISALQCSLCTMYGRLHNPYQMRISDRIMVLVDPEMVRGHDRCGTSPWRVGHWVDTRFSGLSTVLRILYG